MNPNRDPDAVVAAWLDDGPAELPVDTRQAIAVGVRTVPRRRPGISWPIWRGTLRPTLDLPRLSVAVVVVAVVAVVGAIAVSNLRPQSILPAALPTSPSDWTRVVIDPRVEGGVESLFATPRGLVAGVGGDEETKWYFSTDGQTWTEVPPDQIPDLRNPLYQTDSVSVAGDDQQILMVGREVLASADGVNWSRIAGPSQDPELDQGAIEALTAAGPGFVAVGMDNKAWYSTDGSDWTLAEVPSRPGQPSRLRRPLDPNETQGGVGMEGIALSGGNLLAWGKSIWVHDDGSATFVPVFWTSTDGLSWTNQQPPDPTWDDPNVTGGPNGFLMTGEHGPIWLSADGKSWDRVAGTPSAADDAFTHPIAAGRAGYVAAGGLIDGQDDTCRLFGCPSEEAVIWTSPDGRSWTQLPSDELFGGNSSVQRAGANLAAAWGDRFIVGGSFDDKPAVWISSSNPADDNNLPPVPTEDSTPTFTSTIHGYSIDYPSGWQTRPATKPWAGEALDFDSPAADVIFDPSVGDKVYLLIASIHWGGIRPLNGIKGDWPTDTEWLCSGGPAGTWHVDGVDAWVQACAAGFGANNIALVFADERGYLIQLRVASDAAALVEAYGWDGLKALLETVDLRPEDAVDAPIPTESSNLSPSRDTASTNLGIFEPVDGVGRAGPLASGWWRVNRVSVGAMGP